MFNLDEDRMCTWQGVWFLAGQESKNVVFLFLTSELAAIIFLGTLGTASLKMFLLPRQALAQDIGPISIIGNLK